MSDDRQLWLCNSGQSLPVLNCLPLQRKPLFTPFRGWSDTDSTRAEFHGGILWPFIHLPRYSFGPKQYRYLSSTEATLPPICLTRTLQLTGSPSPWLEGKGGSPGWVDSGAPGFNCIRAPGREGVGIQRLIS